MRRVAFILILVGLAETSQAVDGTGLNGLPNLRSVTNLTYWQEFITAYNPIAQLIYANQERYIVARWTGPAFGPDPSSLATVVNLSAGTTATVSMVTNTTGTNVYVWASTNITQVQTQVLVTVAWTNAAWVDTNIVYGYIDPIDSTAHTATSGVPLDYDLLYDLRRAMFREVDTDYNLPPVITRYIATNYHDADYSPWFALTNASNQHPQYFPTNDLVGLFTREGIGYTLAASTDEWGRVYCTNNTEVTKEPAYWSRFPEHTGTWHLAELVASATNWTFRDAGPYVSTVVDPAMRPSIWGTSTGAFGPVTVTLTGTVVNADLTAFVSTQEVVSVSSNPVDCTLLWYDVTGMSSTNTPTNWGDVVHLDYTNVLSAGDADYFDADFYLLGLDEMAQALRAMTHTEGVTRFAGSVLWAAPATLTAWEGISTNSWAEAKTFAETSATPVAVAASAPYKYSLGEMTGSTSAPVWRAYAETLTSCMEVWRGEYAHPKLLTNYGAQAEVYIAVSQYPATSTVPAAVFDAFDFAVTDTNQYMIWSNMTFTGVAITTGVINTESRPDTWPDEPTLTTPTARGWRATDAKAALLWDAAGDGFRYR